jgi:hypothetical protein
LAKYEAFTVQIGPIDYRSLTKRMTVRKHDEKALIPKRSHVAVNRFGRVGHERHIKLSPANKRDVFRRRRALNQLNRYPRVPLRIDLYQFSQESSSHGWLNANDQAATTASTRL